MRTTLLQRRMISVSDFRCTAGPDDKPFVEKYGSYSISYVRKGSFGCCTRGRSFELVTGSILVGYPGDEFMCTHDHVCGDECLSFFLEPELVEMIGGELAAWRVGAAPPLPEMMVLGELAQRQRMAAATSGSTRSGRSSRIVLSRWHRGDREGPRQPRRAIADAPWKRHSGWRRIRIDPSISMRPPSGPASARSISCARSPTCSG